ncbi:MAG: HlyD family secretion protein [Alteromonadaceae bacterium]
MVILDNETSKGSSAVSGSGMDRRIQGNKKPWKKIGIGAIIVVSVGVISSMIIDRPSGRNIDLDQNQLTFANVSEGTFEDFIPIRGQVTPLKTVFLDAIEGGRVERVLVEDGALLKAGDLIVELSNTTLQLDVSRNEALATEQLNNMRTIELQLEQNRLSHKRNLVNIDYQIKRLTRQAQEERELFTKNTLSKRQLDDTQDELDYNIALRDVTLQSQLTDARLQDAQLKFLKSSAVRLESNLVFARKNLDGLNVRAPLSGKLSGFDVQVGQSIGRGGRLGQVDDPQNYKLTVNIDEFYLNRVDVGQRATFVRNGTTFEMSLAKLYPQVNNGQFEADLVFTAAQPEGIRRGQTLQSKLTLGDASKALLIPNGSFFQDTGGNWLFVVTSDGTQAVKRTVKMGRRNARFIEVLEGLQAGERIVTSPYTNFILMDRLTLTQ